MRLICLLVILFSLPACAQEKPDFNKWVAQVKQQALANGISQSVIDNAFENVEAPAEDIVELDHKQPEKTRSFSDYLNGALSDKNISAAKDKWHDNRALLRKVEAKYHVQPKILLALWCIESRFGERQGDFSIIQSLSTLAYDGRRSQFFMGELMNALKIMQDENIASADLTGSWAGAMGQTQFMPSSFLKFAVDFDGDGKKDIWNSDADALASMANYLHSKGWNHNEGWGVEVELPDGDTNWREVKGDKPLKEWRKLGLKREDGRKLPNTELMAHLIMPDDDEPLAYLAFPNYNILMDWNRSTYFATSIGLLADEIAK